MNGIETAFFGTVGIINLGLAVMVARAAWNDPQDSLGRLLRRAAGRPHPRRPLTKPLSTLNIGKESES